MSDWLVTVTVDGRPLEINMLMTEDATWVDAALEALSFDNDKHGWSLPAGSPVTIEITKLEEGPNETNH